MRKLTFAQGINEAMNQACQLSEDVIVLGQLVDYKPGVFGTTSGLVDKHGKNRVQDFPVAESLMTSMALGAALAGMRPVLVHQRLDFMIYSLDAICNWLSLWRFKSGGKASVPVTIRAIVGKGWGQGPQHSKSLHAWFAHLPGIRVAVPSNSFDAKGLLLESILGENPTIFLEHRALFAMTENVPEVPYRVRFGQAVVRRPGKDLTIAALGNMVPFSLKVAETLAGEGIDAEVIDLRTLRPLDRATIVESVRKTRRLAVADPGWRSFGAAAEVMASVSEEIGHCLVQNPYRICLPDSHTPMSRKLEEEYYPTEGQVAQDLRAHFFAKKAKAKAA